MIERDDGTLKIDARMADSEGMVEKLRAKLVEDGLAEAEVGSLRYEGRRRRREGEDEGEGEREGVGAWLVRAVGGRGRCRL